MDSRLTSKDKKILNYLRKDFPISDRPYRIIADKLNLSESFVYKRAGFLKRKKFIRKITPMFDLKRLGFNTTLIALEVSQNKIEEVGTFLNRLDSVTHNYLRDGQFNIWFTLIYESNKEKYNLINALKTRYNIARILDLPIIKKIKLDFKLPI